MTSTAPLDLGVGTTISPQAVAPHCGLRTPWTKICRRHRRSDHQILLCFLFNMPKNLSIETHDQGMNSVTKLHIDPRSRLANNSLYASCSNQNRPKLFSTCQRVCRHESSGVVSLLRGSLARRKRLLIGVRGTKSVVSCVQTPDLFFK